MWVWDTKVSDIKHLIIEKRETWIDILNTASQSIIIYWVFICPMCTKFKTCRTTSTPIFSTTT